MNFQLTNLPELEALITTLVTEAKCACHIINPHKTRILMWKEVKENKEIYHLRIGIQKFTSQEQTDRNGETYWRYWSGEVKTNHQTQTKLDPVKKANDYAQPTNHSEPAVNSSTS